MIGLVGIGVIVIIIMIGLLRGCILMLRESGIIILIILMGGSGIITHGLGRVIILGIANDNNNRLLGHFCVAPSLSAGLNRDFFLAILFFIFLGCRASPLRGGFAIVIIDDHHVLLVLLVLLV